MLFQNVSLDEFKKVLIINKKSVFCFGAGKAFDRFFDEPENKEILRQVKAIADNNYNKNDNYNKIIDDITVPIISVNQMIQSITSEDVILITTAAYQEIILQLEQIDKLKDTKYYLYFILGVRKKDSERMQIPIPDKLSIYDNIQIPKIIHYCWFGKSEIPAQYRKWMESWQRYCPDYRIIEWNEDNYDIRKNRYISEAYEKKMWAFVSDYVRIDVVNEYGGVYLDTDIELLRNIDELLKNDGFCGFQNQDNVNFGLGFGAVKKHKTLEEIKKYYETERFILEDGTLNLTACPVIQTEIMKRHGLKCNGMFQVVDGMTVLPSRVLCGMSPNSFRVEKNPVKTYAIHHFAASWKDEKFHDCKRFVYSCLKEQDFDDGYCYLK